MTPKNISRATPDPGEAASWERTTTTSSFIWLDDDRSKLTNSLPETYCTAVNPISAALGGAWRRAIEWALFNDVLSVQGGPSTFAAVNEGFHRPARILCGIQVRPASFDISAGLLDGIAYSDTSSRGCCLIRR